MSLKEALEILKTQIYEIHLNGQIVGYIKRFSDEYENGSRPGLIFSNEDLLDLLHKDVFEIIPQSVEPEEYKCVLVLEFF